MVVVAKLAYDYGSAPGFLFGLRSVLSSPNFISPGALFEATNTREKTDSGSNLNVEPPSHIFSHGNR